MTDQTSPPWKMDQPSRGLGDTVAKVAHAVGADKVANMWEEITGRDCGCPKRQAYLNQLFSYQDAKEDA